MKWTTSCARAASNVVVGERQVLGRRLQHVDARVARPRGRDERLRGIDGRHGAGPSRATSSAVRAPGPQPTSSTRWPARTPAKSASCGESCVEYRPMKRSYASAATSKLTSATVRRRALLDSTEAHGRSQDRRCEVDRLSLTPPDRAPGASSFP